MKTAYKICRATAAEKVELARLFADFAADFCLEKGETLKLAANGITINRAFAGYGTDNDWQFIKCSCGRIDIRCIENDHVFCCGCSSDLEIVNRKKEASDKKHLA